MIKLAVASALMSLASCRATEPASHDAIAKLTVTSDAFRNGQPIPAQFTCDGANQAPPLHWSEPPAGTKSFALVIDDPDAPGGTFRHWGVSDIPVSARSFGGAQKAGTEVNNDFGKPGYGGPCPPKGNGLHHYHFKLFAVDVERLGLSRDSKVVDVERAAEQHAIAQGELVGTYERH
jgi:Raf kinase inhibitor-like YbhB/YbcL family protein